MVASAQPSHSARHPADRSAREASGSAASGRSSRTRRLALPMLVLALVTLVGCGGRYEARSTVAGVFTPLDTVPEAGEREILLPLGGADPVPTAVDGLQFYRDQGRPLPGLPPRPRHSVDDLEISIGRFDSSLADTLPLIAEQSVSGLDGRLFLANDFNRVAREFAAIRREAGTADHALLDGEREAAGRRQALWGPVLLASHDVDTALIGLLSHPVSLYAGSAADGPDLDALVEGATAMRQRATAHDLVAVTRHWRLLQNGLRQLIAHPRIAEAASAGTVSQRRAFRHHLAAVAASNRAFAAAWQAFDAELRAHAPESKPVLVYEPRRRIAAPRQPRQP